MAVTAIINQRASVAIMAVLAAIALGVNSRVLCVVSVKSLRGVCVAHQVALDLEGLALLALGIFGRGGVEKTLCSDFFFTFRANIFYLHISFPFLISGFWGAGRTRGGGEVHFTVFPFQTPGG